MATNDYFVIGLWEGIWDQGDPGKYFRGFLQDKEDLQESTALVQNESDINHQTRPLLTRRTPVTILLSDRSARAGSSEKNLSLSLDTSSHLQRQ